MATKMYLPPKGESRRGVLRNGLFGGALLALGGGAWVTLRPGKTEPMPAGGLTVLTLTEYSLVAAVARRLVPQGGKWPSPDQLGVALRADGLLANVDETTRIDLRRLFNLMESGLSSLFSGVSAAPFTTLSAEQQDAVLESWSTSRVAIKRTGYTGLRRLVLGVYFGYPEVWPAVGYPGPPGLHDPHAPVWKGGGEPRPEGLGVWHEPEVTP